MEKEKCGVYAIKNSLNGRLYVGSSHNIAERTRQHFNLLKNGKHSNSPMQADWGAFGSEAFEKVLLEECEPEALVATEQRWLDKLAPFGAQGYNKNKSAASGYAGRRMNDETKAKLAEAQREYQRKNGNAMKGKKRPDLAVRNRTSEISEKRREQIRAGNSARFKGKTLSPEHRAKISAALKGKKKSAAHRKSLSDSKKREWDALGDDERKLRREHLK